MRFLWVMLALVLVLVACNKSNHSVVGSWAMNSPYGVMNINFKEDDTYDGTIQQGTASAQMKGTYKLSGNRLELQPPTVTLSDGSTTVPGGGPMRLEATFKSENMVELYDGKDHFSMTKTSASP